PQSVAGDAVFCAQEEYPAATLKSDAMLRIFNDLVELRKGFPFLSRYSVRKIALKLVHSR
ncbi:MAG: hypothetical protein WC997_16955, partial [Porticoccaceae bacterium]